MQIYKCPYCTYQKDSWSVKRHISRKHVASQTGHGVQQGEQIIPNQVQKIISQQQKQNFNYIRQLKHEYETLGNKYENLRQEANEMNKYIQDQDSKIVNLQNHIQALEHANIKWQEAYHNQVARR